MVEIVWKSSAINDLIAIVDYISDENPDAASALLDLLETRAQQLELNPRSGRLGRVNGTRELVAHANYVIVYREELHVVTVLRVLHAAQMWP